MDRFFLSSITELTNRREVRRRGRLQCSVLAGAGSGKTRVLVHRIAWFECHAYELSLTCFDGGTFTNKAARRKCKDVSNNLFGVFLPPRHVGWYFMVWLTFFITRSLGDARNWKKTFRSWNSDDQITSHQTHYARTQVIDDTRWPQSEKRCLGLSMDKRRSRRAAHVPDSHDPLYQKYARTVYNLWRSLWT